MSGQNVKIQYGIFSGERTGKRFRKALRKAGYRIVKDANQADIIIAHSAGCFWLPTAPTHQKLLLIDPPYWPGKPIRDRAAAFGKTHLQFLSYGYTIRYWITRNLWGLYYAIRDFRRTSAIIKFAQIYDLDETIENHQVLLVRNEQDDFLTPYLQTLQSHHPTLRIVVVPGDHDDCMFNPQPYVDLLQSELNT